MKNKKSNSASTFNDALEAMNDATEKGKSEFFFLSGPAVALMALLLLLHIACIVVAVVVVIFIVHK